jgi:hypothetical protein
MELSGIEAGRPARVDGTTEARRMDSRKVKRSGFIIVWGGASS